MAQIVVVIGVGNKQFAVPFGERPRVRKVNVRLYEGHYQGQLLD